MNARKEFEQATKGLKLIAAEVGHCDRWYDDDPTAPYRLKVGHTPEQLAAFLRSLDWEYSDGYGSQNVYGSIHCEGCTIIRHEYDGSENWQHVYHAIPAELHTLSIVCHCGDVECTNDHPDA